MTNSKVQQLITRNAELEAENQGLRNRIVELEQQIAKLVASPASAAKTATTVPDLSNRNDRNAVAKSRGKNRDTPAVIAIVPPKLTKLLKLL
jgi:regulator of replication initiation timing